MATLLEADRDLRPKTSNPYDDHETVRALVRRRRDAWGKSRDQHLLTQWRNLLFYRGHQWIFLDRTQGRLRPVRVKPGTPLCVTNRYSSTMDGFNSVLTRIEPKLTFRPATEEAADRAAADVADKAMAVIEHEADVRLVRQELGNWVGLTGGAWIEVGYDPDPRWGAIDMPVAQCLTCGYQDMTTEPMCPQCGSPLQPAMDPQTGQPIVQSVPRGRLYMDVVPMFEMYFDPTIPQWSKHRAYIRRKGLSEEEAKARWKELADQITAGTSANLGQQYLEQVATMAGYMDAHSGPIGSSGFGPLSGGIGPQVTEEYYWQLPDEVYPEGLLHIGLGDNLTASCGPLPYTALTPDGSRQPFLPTVWFPQKIVPGSLWPKTIADDLALKQVQRNKWESIIERCGQRMANPVWLKPSGANVGAFPSDPGGVIEYNALGPSPAKPERIPGQPVTPGLQNRLDAIDRDFQEESALFEIMKGNRPAGVSAGVALQMLQERAMHRFGPMLIVWEESWAKVAGMALEIFRQYATEDRILRIKGKDGGWQVSKFAAADLSGRVDIVPEAGSSLPRSSLVERAEMEQAFSLGILDPREPRARQKALEKYNMSEFVAAMAADAKNAIMEQEQWEQIAQNPQAVALIAAELSAWQVAQQQAAMPVPPQMVQGPLGPEMVPGPPPPPPPSYDQLVQQIRAQGVPVPRVREAVDDPVIHSLEHGVWLKSETAMRLPEPLQRLAEMHKAEHDRKIADSQQAPPPKVNVALRSELPPQAGMQMAGLDPSSVPPGPQPGAGQGKSGLLDTPNIVSRPRKGEGSGNAGRRAAAARQNPLRTGSSPQRMMGEVREGLRGAQG